MKKINQHRILQWKVAVLLLVILSGCTKDLDLSPRQQINEASFWKTANHFKIATNNYYITLLPGHDLGEFDVNSDISHAGVINIESTGKNALPENDNIWDETYTALRQINTLLVKAAEYKGNQSEIAVSVAEGKFFRAFAYFNLVARFGDVPYFDRPLTGLKDELLKKPRTPRETVVKNILKDLDDAAKALPLQSTLAPADNGRITKGAAQALKARVALFEATWVKYHKTPGDVNGLLDQAIAAARAVIGSAEYELYTDFMNPNDSYLQSYLVAGNDSREQILARRYVPTLDANHSHFITSLVGFNLFGGTKKLADMYACTDGLPITKSKLFQKYGTMTSEYKNRDLRMSNTFMIPGSKHSHATNPSGDMPNFPDPTILPGYRIRKLVSTDQDCWFAFRCIEFKHILKYSELLLNLAEALYEKNGSISDGELDATINLLRERGGVAKLTNALVDDNGLKMLEEIRRERTVELAFDHFRLYDLKRWKTAVKELTQDIKGVNIGGGAWDGQFPGISAGDKDAKGFLIVEPKAMRQFAERNYLFPLPAQQVQLSQGVLTQNPGW